MKNLMTFALAFVMVLTSSFSAVAKGDNDDYEEYPLSVKSGSNGKYNLMYDSDNKENVIVRIYNENGRLVHVNYIRNQKGLNIDYDLNQLPEGQYKVKLTVKKKSYSTIINHLREKNKESEINSFFKAYVKSEESNRKYSIRVIRQIMKPVLVSIIDNKDKEIFTETIDVDHNFKKIYDLSLPSLNAKSIKISSGSNVVYYDIEK